MIEKLKFEELVKLGRGRSQKGVVVGKDGEIAVGFGEEKIDKIYTLRQLKAIIDKINEIIEKVNEDWHI